MKDLILILGAGSSQTYNLPSSTELNNEIEKILKSSKGIHEKEPKLEYINVLGAILRTIYSSPADGKLIEEFYFKFTHDYFHTIDEFLLGKSEPLMTLGKTLIAMVILYHENREILTNRLKTDGWYGTFWRQIKEYLVEKKRGLERIKFLTFNYDRSLEQFIFHNLHSIDDAPLIRLKEFNIDHIYGTVGRYPFHEASKNDIETIPYGEGLSHQYDFQKRVVSAREMILHPKQIEKASPETYDFENKINLPIMTAKNIFFLGCGYHTSNLKILNIQNTRAKVMGTGFKLEKYWEARVRKKFPKIIIQNPEIDNVEFYNTRIAEAVEEVFEG